MTEGFYSISTNVSPVLLHLSNYIVYDTSSDSWGVVEDVTLEYEHVCNYPVTLATLIRMESKFTSEEKISLANIYANQFPSPVAQERFINSPGREISHRFPFTSFDLENREELKLFSMGALEDHAVLKSNYLEIPGFEYVCVNVPYTTTRRSKCLQWKKYSSLRLSPTDMRIVDAVKSSFKYE